jgi:hypothetical protein
MLARSEEEPSLIEAGEWVGFKLGITVGTIIRRSVNYFVLFVCVNFKVKIYRRRNTEHYLQVALECTGR